MSSGQELLQIMRKAALSGISHTQPADILFGTVTSRRPLIIETDQKLVLTHEFLVLSRNVTDYKTWISFDNPDIKQKVSIFDRAEKESESEPLPTAIEAGEEPHEPRPDDKPPPKEEKTTDIQFLKKWYENTLGIEDENGGVPEKIELPAFHDITVYNHLRVGERVIMVKESGGQRYFVLDREGYMTDKERGL